MDYISDKISVYVNDNSFCLMINQSTRNFIKSITNKFLWIDSIIQVLRDGTKQILLTCGTRYAGHVSIKSIYMCSSSKKPRNHSNSVGNIRERRTNNLSTMFISWLWQLKSVKIRRTKKRIILFHFFIRLREKKLFLKILYHIFNATLK